MGANNKWHGLGNLTRDPELRHLASGMAVVNLGMAVNDAYTNKDGQKVEDTTYIDIEFWDRQAEVIAQHCRKGQLLSVEGKLKTDTWEDKNSGEKRSKLKVRGTEFTFAGGKKDGGDAASDEAPPTRPSRPPAPSPGRRPIPPPADNDEDDIPF